MGLYAKDRMEAFDAGRVRNCRIELNGSNENKDKIKNSLNFAECYIYAFTRNEDVFRSILKLFLPIQPGRWFATINPASEFIDVFMCVAMAVS